MPREKPSRITTLGFAILGLLQQGPLTGYRIRMVFETTPMGHYSSSPGSIYPALDRLRKSGHIRQVWIKNELKTTKKYFQLTSVGKIALQKWFRQPIHQDDMIRGLPELLLRFAFMENVLSLELRIDFLESFQTEVDQYVKLLEDYLISEGDAMPMHGRLSMENGIESYKAHSRWAKHALEVLRKQKTE